MYQHQESAYKWRAYQQPILSRRGAMHYYPKSEVLLAIYTFVLLKGCYNVWQPGFWIITHLRE